MQDYLIGDLLVDSELKDGPASPTLTIAASPPFSQLRHSTSVAPRYCNADNMERN